MAKTLVDKHFSEKKLRRACGHSAVCFLSIDRSLHVQMFICALYGYYVQEFPETAAKEMSSWDCNLSNSKLEYIYRKKKNFIRFQLTSKINVNILLSNLNTSLSMCQKSLRCWMVKNIFLRTAFMLHLNIVDFIKPLLHPESYPILCLFATKT